MALCRRISDLYALALLTVYALFLPLGGYERMMEGKYRAFLLLSLGYVLAMTALGAWRAVRWREPMCLAALAYLALTALSAALSPYGTAVLLGGTRRDGLLTAALYATSFCSSRGTCGLTAGCSMPRRPPPRCAIFSCSSSSRGGIPFGSTPRG